MSIHTYMHVVTTWTGWSVYDSYLCFPGCWWSNEFSHFTPQQALCSTQDSINTTSIQSVAVWVCVVNTDCTIQSTPIRMLQDKYSWFSSYVLLLHKPGASYRGYAQNTYKNCYQPAIKLLLWHFKVNAPLASRQGTGPPVVTLLGGAPKRSHSSAAVVYSDTGVDFPRPPVWLCITVSLDTASWTGSLAR